MSPPTRPATGGKGGDVGARSKAPERVAVQRFAENPLLLPRPEHGWESRFVFNPAAIQLGERIHLIYRAIGDQGRSVFGHASSSDGIRFDERCEHPVYQCSQPLHESAGSGMPVAYASGGSSSGCEDPRVVRIGDTLYMTYTSFGGWDHPPAVALTSIAVNDFLDKKWNWSPPRLISRAGEMHKNWVIFPERFDGRYAILHSLAPEILIEYVDSLDRLRHDSIRSHHFPDQRKDAWDTWIRGAGAPPIRIGAGWLLFYHAMDRRDPDRYKLGVMLLDGDNPTRILARLPWPLLEPNAPYENEGFKAGVIYNCGAVIRDDQLYVYYGGADAVTCGGSISLGALLTQLKSE